MDLETLKNDIVSYTPTEFCRSQLFSQDMWFFDDGPDDVKGSYHDFKCTVSEILDTNPNNVALVGSAKFGLSLNPNKNWREFDSASDLDIVIVSKQQFNEIWACYRKAFYNGFPNLVSYHGENVFKGFVVVSSKDYPEFKSEFLRPVWLKMQKLVREIQINHRISREIKFRIYADWADVEEYHFFGIRMLRKALQDES